MGLPLFKAPDESEPNFTASMEKFLSNSRSSIRRNLFRAIPRLDVHGRLNSGAQRQPGSDITLDDDYDDRGRTSNLANHIPHLESSSTSWTSQTLRILDHERERIRLRNCPSIEYQRILTPENRISSTEPEDNLRQDEFMNLPSRIRPLRESRRALTRRTYLSRPVLTDETTPRLVPSMLDVEPSSIDMYFRDLSNATPWQPVIESFENNNNETFSRRHPLSHTTLHRTRTRTLSELASQAEEYRVNIPQSNTNEQREDIGLNSESDDSWDNAVPNSFAFNLQPTREGSIDTVISTSIATSTNSSQTSNPDKNDGSTPSNDYVADPKIEMGYEDLDKNEDEDEEGLQSLNRRNSNRTRVISNIVAAQDNVIDYTVTPRINNSGVWDNLSSTATEPNDLIDNLWASAS